MTIEELQIVISAEIKDLKEGVEEALGEVKKLEKNGGGGWEKFGKAAASAGKVAIAGVKMAATAVAAGAGAMVALSESTEEYRTAQVKLTTAFEAAGSSAEQAKDTFNNLYRVLGDDQQAVEAANHLAKLTTNQKELQEWTTICQGVYATFGDSLPIENLTEAANETAKVGKLTGGLADALNWAGVNEEEFQAQLDACTTEQEREALIRATLNEIYDDAAGKYEENAASILAANEAQAKLTESLAILGEAVAPIVTLFKQFGADILAELVPGLTMMIEGIQGILEGTEGAAEKFQEGLGGVIDTLLTRFTEALPQILEIGLQIITTLIEGVLQVLPEVVTTIIGVIPQITDAIIELLPLIIEVGIELIKAIIQGLTDTAPELLQQVVELLPEIINLIIEAIPDLLDASIEFFMAIVDAIPEIIPILADALPDIIDAIIDALLDAFPIVIDAAIELFLAIVDAIPEMIPSLVAALPEIISSIVEGLIKAVPQILAAAVKLFLAIPTGLLNIIPNLITAAGELIKKIKDNVVEKAKSIMKFEWSLPELKLPSVSVTGKFSLNPLSIPKFSLSWNRLGGVFEDPAIFFGNGGLQGLGEDGAEAIVPLEKNTEWMNVLATKLAERMGYNNTPIVLQMDGKTLAETTIGAINELTRQTGKLGLVVT